MLEIFHEYVGSDTEPIAWWQMTIRALIVFFYGLLLVRLGARRMLGRNTAFDILMAVIIGSILSRTLTGNAPFLPTMAAVTALVLLHWLLAVLSYYSDALAFLTKGTKRRLVEKGKIDWKQMRAGKVGKEDLMEALRMKGTADIEEVEQACLERGGEISIVRRDQR